MSLFFTKARMARAAFLTATVALTTSPSSAQLTQAEAEAWLAETCQPSAASNGTYAIEVDERGRALLTLTSPSQGGQSMHCRPEELHNDPIHFERDATGKFIIGTYQISPECQDYRYLFSDSPGWETMSFYPSCPLPISGGRAFDVYVELGGSITLNMDNFEELWPSTFSGMTIVSAEPGEVPVSRAPLELSGPNPFRSATRFRLELPEPAEVQVSIYDHLGREVAVLVEGLQSAGRHPLYWDASGFPSGTYFVRLTAPDGTHEVRQVTLVR